MSALVAAFLSAALIGGCSARLFAPEPTQTPQPTPTPVPPHLSVTWASGGQVVLWRDGAAVQIAEKDADAPLFAPDGQTIAFVRNPVGGQQSLWIARLDEGSARPMGDPLPLVNGRTEFAQLAWADHRTLYYTTQIALPQSTRRQYDLHKIDVSTGKIGQVLRVGLGGMITFSPDGEQAVLMDPGYPGGSVDGSIVLFDAVALSGHIKITFPPAGKGGLAPFDLPIDWQSDSSAFYVSTAAWDKVLVPGKDNLRVSVWRTAINDFSRTMGILQADIWGMPRVSPDGARIVYLRHPLASGDAQTLDVVIADLDNSGAHVYASGSADAVGAPHWLTNEYFVYRFGDTLMLGKLGGQPQRLPDSNPSGAPILAGNWLVYPGKAALLVAAPLDALDQYTPIGTAISGQPPPRFDAVIAR